MYCRYCGKEVKDKAVVCSGCGHPVEEVAGTVATGRRWSWFTMFVTIAVLVALLLVAIIAGL